MSLSTKKIPPGDDNVEIKKRKYRGHFSTRSQCVRVVMHSCIYFSVSYEILDIFACKVKFLFAFLAFFCICIFRGLHLQSPSTGRNKRMCDAERGRGTESLIFAYFIPGTIFSPILPPPHLTPRDPMSIGVGQISFFNL